MVDTIAWNNIFTEPAKYINVYKEIKPNQINVSENLGDMVETHGLMKNVKNYVPYICL